ncbi:MAG: tRNA adenosine(34) deaminase TadA [Acidobacteria bacterium]|nr:tRNA adenosine(34) deaminase TadA [Acidobacteriota bacterium]MBI3425147.1 tRNA adenosine(34) deaminase TadA [Acidobacteriota bacterium]
MSKQPAKKQVSNLSELKISDEFFMACALAEARQAYALAEVPVGAVIVLENQIIGRGYNQPIGRCDPIAHAEILALREASQHISNYRLVEATLYVTIEPCVMCAGALINARVKRLVYGAAEERFGAVDSLLQLCTHSSLNHRMGVTSGILAEECRGLMQNFFKQRRSNNQ